MVFYLNVLGFVFESNWNRRYNKGVSCRRSNFCWVIVLFSYSDMENDSDMMFKDGMEKISVDYRKADKGRLVKTRKRKEKSKVESKAHFLRDFKKRVTNADSLLEEWNLAMDDGIKDGLLKVCIHAGCGIRTLGSVLNVGSYRFNRVKANKPLEKTGGVNGHEITEEMKGLFEDHVKTFDCELGFSCAHRVQKLFIKQPGTSWKMHHDQYIALGKASDIKCMQYSTYTRYIKVCAPNVRLARPKQDECDTCHRFRVLLQDENL